MDGSSSSSTPPPSIHNGVGALLSALMAQALSSSSSASSSGALSALLTQTLTSYISSSSSGSTGGGGKKNNVSTSIGSMEIPAWNRIVLHNVELKFYRTTSYPNDKVRFTIRIDEMEFSWNWLSSSSNNNNNDDPSSASLLRTGPSHLLTVRGVRVNMVSVSHQQPSAADNKKAAAIAADDDDDDGSSSSSTTIKSARSSDDDDDDHRSKGKDDQHHHQEQQQEVEGGGGRRSSHNNQEQAGGDDEAYDDDNNKQHPDSNDNDDSSYNNIILQKFLNDMTVQLHDIECKIIIVDNDDNDDDSNNNDACCRGLVVVLAWDHISLTPTTTSTTTSSSHTGGRGGGSPPLQQHNHHHHHPPSMLSRVSHRVVIESMRVRLLFNNKDDNDDDKTQQHVVPLMDLPKYAFRVVCGGYATGADGHDVVLDILGEVPDARMVLHAEPLLLATRILQRQFFLDHPCTPSSNDETTPPQHPKEEEGKDHLAHNPNVSSCVKVLLPLPPLELILPTNNGTRTRLELDGGCSFRYNSHSGGGSTPDEMQLFGSNGLRLCVDGLRCVELAPTVLWKFDVLSRALSVVESPKNIDNHNYRPRAVLRIEWHPTHVRALISSFRALQELLDVGSNNTDANVAHESTEDLSISIGGLISFSATSKNGDCVEASLDGVDCHISGGEVVCLMAGQSTVGPTSLGSDAYIRIPALHLKEDQRTLCISDNGAIECRCGSLAILDRIQPFLVSAFVDALVPLTSNHATTTENDDESALNPIIVVAPSILVEIMDLKMRFLARKFCMEQRKVYTVTLQCGHITAEGSGASIALANIDACYDLRKSDLTLNVAAVDSLYIPGLLCLKTPVTNGFSVSWKDGRARFDMESVSILQLEGQTHQDGDISTVYEVTEPPFHLDANLGQINLSSVHSEESVTVFEGVKLLISPDAGASFDVRFDSVRTEWVHIDGAGASGLVLCGASNTVSRLVVDPGLISIVADYSSVKWSKVFEHHEGNNGVQSGLKCVWFLPHAKIRPCRIRISFDAELISTESAHQLAGFVGGPDLTSTCLLNYVKKAGLRELPLLYNNTRVFGERATDLTAKAAGRMSGSTLAGSALGSIGGLVIVDTVRTIFCFGLENQDLTIESRSRFSVFGMGVCRAIKSAAMNGGRLRRGATQRYRYRIGDFSTGLSDWLGNYLNENRSRFAAAGVSVVGMTFGGMTYGIAGMLIGNVVGAQVGAKAFDNLLEEDVSEDVVDADEDWVLL